NRTYRATRRDVRIEQLVAAMGERYPAYPDTQRQFRVLFVLVSREGATDDALAQIDSIRLRLESDFRAATSGRGTLRTGFAPDAPVRRRAVRP
ncbi:MAG TPA: hypothetical protein VFT12_01445, partial [Thermoanaerobaculia bacterium]|nr:hypothetical protein [Thermoanaerobaculia bacterium]